MNRIASYTRPLTTITAREREFYLAGFRSGHRVGTADKRFEVVRDCLWYVLLIVGIVAGVAVWLNL